MNAFASECTSGCESGWTLYLEQSFLSPATTTSRGMVDIRISGNFYGNKKESNIVGDNIEEEEEQQQEQEDDLSMLSDASSGPPHFNEEDQSNNYFNFDQNIGGDGGRKRRKERKSRRSHEEKQEAVDDTASSPAFNFYKSNFGLPNNNPDYSQDFSATNFQGRSAYQPQFGYVQPSLSGNQLQNNQWY